MNYTRREALKKALQIEAEGLAYYRTAEEKASSVLGRDIFGYLKRCEQHHARRVKQLFDELESSGNWPQGAPQGDLDKPPSPFDGAQARLAAQESIDDSDIDALRKAIAFERSGEDFYRQRAMQVRDPFEKAFYACLAEEEAEHLAALQDCLRSLEDPNSFHTEQAHEGA